MAKKKTQSSAQPTSALTTNARKLDMALYNLARTVVSRAILADKLGKSYWPSSGGKAKRDLYKALGYEKAPNFNSYYARYRRQDIAKAIVDAPALATWGRTPLVSEKQKEETQFEEAWSELVKSKHIYSFLRRTDRISGIGEYGVLFLGFDDVQSAKELKNPVGKAKNLLYLRPFTQASVSVKEWEDDPSEEQFGLPRIYSINVLGGTGASAKSEVEVHRTRVIHVAEGLVDNDVYGTPRLECVLNRLADLELISGGSAEMFWRGGFPGYVFKADSDANLGTQDLDDLEDEIQDYLHELRRYIRLQGIEVKPLEVQIASPRDHFDILVTLIAAGVRMPKRILLGSERGELASSQDERAWQDRIDERRTNFAESVLLRPLIDRLIGAGVLPEPETYSVEWPSMLVLGPKEQMEIARSAAEAIARYVSAPGAEAIVPVEIFLSKYLHWTQEEIDQRAQLVGDLLEEISGGV